MDAAGWGLQEVGSSGVQVPLLEVHDPHRHPQGPALASAYVTLARARGPNKHEAVPYHRGLVKLDALDQEA